ncbi:MAG: thiamine phosphate synthase [Gammaproteobacteria bacterium]|nr:thiamine phosphate synthase [Gammaproteobacteria bacterium]
MVTPGQSVKQAVPGSGLYAITDTGLPGDTPVERAVEQAILGGARMIQYREKHRRGAGQEATATRLAAVCRHHGIPLIINDDIDLAARCGASGVHLGRDDSPLQAARELLGDEAIIGISCYDSLSRATEAAAAGADYVAFGRFYPSRSKPQAVPADPSLLTRARAELEVPVVAIGGITPANGAALLAAGAGLLAAIEGVFGQPDIKAAARGYADLFES